MAAYPCLKDLITDAELPLDPGAAGSGRATTDDAGRKFRIRPVGPAYVLEPLARHAGISVDGRAVTASTPLLHGSLIGCDGRWLRFLERAEGGAYHEADLTLCVPAGPGPDGAGPARVLPELPPLELGEDRVTTLGRDRERVDHWLDHPMVSRTHAQVVRRGDLATLTDNDSANGTFVDGERVRGAVALRAGRRVDLGPFAFRFDGRRLVQLARADEVELRANDLSRKCGDSVLLDGVSLVVRPCEFVAILGPSGAGKSTLLKALSARERADRGSVLINGQDLYAHFDAIKHDVAVVHQRDALHENLTLEKVLDYTARLRLPPDTSPAERRERVSAMIRDLALAPQRDTPVRCLSGGQLKRASLANETLHGPNLLFLDEVTSGLDEPTDRELMRLFRRLATQGRTVICVTHTLVNVEECCHLIVFLAPGGRLAFVGTAAEARAYFGVERLGDIYELLLGRDGDVKKLPEDWREEFRRSDLYRKYVIDRGALSAGPPTSAGGPVASGSAEVVATAARQLPVLLARLFALQRADPGALAMTFAQPLIVAAALFLLFGDIGGGADPVVRVEDAVKLSFLAAISALWFGVNGAAKEFVKERTIFTRERQANLQPEGYYAAKLLMLGGVAAIEATALFGLVDRLCDPPWGRATTLGLLAALGVAGTSIGLWISATAATEEVAVGLAPIALIPQVIFAGVVAPLSGSSLLLAQLGIAAYWGCEGLQRGIRGLDALPGRDDGPRLALVVVVLAFQVAAFTLAGAVQLRSGEPVKLSGLASRLLRAPSRGRA